MSVGRRPKDVKHVECDNDHVYHERPHGKKGCSICELRNEVLKEFGETRGALRVEMEDLARTLRGEQAAVARELRQDITLIKDKVDRFIGRRTDFTELSFTDPLQAMAWATAPEHRMIEVVCEEDPKADGCLVYIARRV